MTYNDFNSLTKGVQDDYIKEILPIINVVNNHPLCFDDVYAILEVLTPVISNKCLHREQLKDYLKIKLRIQEEGINISDYK